MRKSLALFLFVVLLMNGLSAQSTRDSLVSELNTFLTQTSLPGVGVCISSKDKALYIGGHGISDRAQNRAYTSETIQPIASISKTIIAIALMQLVEQGKLDLDTDINTILPFNVHNPNYPDVNITLAHLASHTSSINDTYQAHYAGYYIINETGQEKTFPKNYQKDYKQFLKSKRVPYATYLKSHLCAKEANYNKKIFGKYPPGTQYEYSNIASTLAAYIVELVAGQPFKEYTQENIFSPLSMVNTVWDKNYNSDNQATLYFQNGALVPDYINIFFPSSTLHTNSDDMAKYMMEMIKGYNGESELLNQSSYNYMLSSKTAGIDSEESRGIFWLVPNESNFSHDGSNMGVRTKVIFNRDTNLGIFLMTNIGTSEDNELTAAYYGVLSILGKYAGRLNND